MTMPCHAGMYSSTSFSDSGRHCTVRKVVGTIVVVAVYVEGVFSCVCVCACP